MQKQIDIILDFTHTYTKEWMEKFPGLHHLDCSDIGGTDMYCTKEAQTELERRLQAYPINGIHFLDSGNYHYLTRLFTKRIEEPYQLVFFDNHNDMQPSMIPDLLSCGAWAKQVMEEDSHLERMFLIGPSRSAIHEIPSELQLSKKPELVCVSREELREREGREPQNETGWQDMLSGRQPVYLSIDKDVLSQEYARTNWDQGELELGELEEILQWIKSRNRIIGVDICGEFPDAPTFQASEAQRVNERTNATLYEMFAGAVTAFTML
ncbi:MAG: arginase family protein [Bacteroidales bacterium]|nr:arginase family protein [Lachnoclostridium sp.]MCM1384718.1 arginase family protein [Lachnoclostridium sp.]MCM1465268.1 arginase family protein [Bacteroidales bacterium]